MRRLWIVAVVALGGVAMLWASLASRPAPSPAAARKAPPAPPLKEAVPEASPTALLVRDAEKELLALCEERDGLLREKARRESSRTSDGQIWVDQAEVEILKHIRDARQYLDAGKHSLALRSYERAEAAILRAPTEIRGLSDLLLGVRDAKGKAMAALAGASTATSIADEHYRLALAHFQRSDFDRAKAECVKAVQADPDHLSARSLLREVGFLQGSR